MKLLVYIPFSVFRSGKIEKELNRFEIDRIFPDFATELVNINDNLKLILYSQEPTDIEQHPFVVPNSVLEEFNQDGNISQIIGAIILEDGRIFLNLKFKEYVEIIKNIAYEFCNCDLVYEKAFKKIEME